VASPARVAQIAGAVALAILVLSVGGTLLYRKAVVMEVTAQDRQTLAVASEFISNPPCQEKWSKRRTLDWGTKVSYDCNGLGKSKTGSVSSWRIDTASDAGAARAFKGGQIGIRAGFAAGARANERIEDGPTITSTSDEARAWTMYVGDKKAGVGLLLRSRKHIWFLMVNGYSIEEWKLNEVATRHVAAMDALDP
jgi:hypothetical protein